jgi:hypothetical protein
MLFKKQIEKVYRGNVFLRKDVDGSIFYFSPSDFDGLVCEPFPFKSFAGVNLSGYVYYYGEQSKTRLLVFDHGMGAGHRAYMKEIELLARNGILFLPTTILAVLNRGAIAPTVFLNRFATLTVL